MYAPEYVAPVTGDLIIYYTDQSGAQITQPQTRTLEQGQYTVTPDAASIPSTYTLASGTPGEYTVTVDATGTVSPLSVTFVYEPVQQQPVSGTLTVYYTDESGNPLSSAETRTLDPGDYTVTPDAAMVPDGYTLSSASQAQYAVSVSSQGVVSPDSVTFVYAVVQQQPATGTLTIQYQDSASGQVLTSSSQSLETGSYTLSIDESTIPSGYSLAEGAQTQFSVTVDAYGTVSPDTITFTLTATTAQGYTITPVERYAVTNAPAVNLRATPNSSISTNIVFPTVEQGTQVWVNGTFILSDREWAFISYQNTDCYVWSSLIDLVSDTPETASGTLTVRYLTADGTAIADDQTLTLETGTYEIYPDTAHVPDGYAWVSTTAAAYEVIVDGNGAVSPASVTFTYAPSTAQVNSGTLTVRYLDTSGAAIATDQTLTLETGAYNVTPDAAHIPDGYTLAASSAASYAVVVDSSGYVDPETIAFTYTQAAAAVQSGTLTVRYLDASGAAIADDQLVTLETGAYTITPDSAHVPDGYTLAAGSDTTHAVTVDASGVVSPASVTFTYTALDLGDPEDISGQYSDYTLLGTTAVTNDSGVRFRSTPTSASIYNIVAQVPTGTEVWVHGSFTNSGNLWAYIRYNNTDCYVWYSLLDVDEASVPVRGTLTVQYRLADGTELVADQSLPLEVGTYTITPDLIPSGYLLSAASPAQVAVTVDSSGGVTPATVTFVCEKEPATGTLTVQYRLADGSEVAADQTLSLATGTHTITPDASLISGEYDLADPASAQVTVTVDASGGVAPNPVVFTYTLDAEASPPADISGTYADYTPLDVSAVTNDTAVNLRSTPKSTITTNIISKVPLGTAVWVHGSFTIGDRMWAYVRYADVDCYVWYSLLTLSEKQEPVTGTLTVQYQTADGGTLAADQSITLEEGSYPITPDTSLIPSGYLLSASSASQYTVTVDSTGAVSPASVAFVYEQEAVSGTLTVQYQNTDGGTLAASQTLTLAPGSHTVTPDPSLIPSGYVLSAASASQYAVSVSATGVVSPASVAFVYEQEVIPGTLTIQYLVGDANVITPQTRTLTAGTYTISVDESLIPTGYELAASSPTSYNVTVSAAGVVSPATVVFQLTASETESGLEMYVGYAVTTTQVALRDNANFEDSSILTTLDADTLLYVNGQVDVSGTVWTGAQTYLGTSVIGLLPYASVRTITPGEAQAYINAYNAAHNTITPSPSPSPSPAQRSGYYLTLGDDVPLRKVPGNQASVATWLAEDQVLYVNEQVYYGNYTWDIAYYGNYIGYVRDDQIRAMTTQEVSSYLASTTPMAPPVVTAEPYDPYADSSYGYVTSNSVNFRQSPNGTRIGTLNQYAFGLVLGTQTVNGTTWYNINQSGTTGWVSGGYFTVLNLQELQSFLNSSEYLEGIVNSSSGSSTTSTSSTSTGSATQGQVSSVEDWNVGVWQNPSSSLSASYEPFNPYATPTATIAEVTATPEPTATFVIGTMIPITYEDDTKETQTGSNWVGLVLGGIVLIGGAGGVYAYALTQNKKRKASARAAAARRSQQQQSNAQNNPYARRAAAAPPIAGEQQKSPYQRPNPYARPENTPANPYATPQQQATGRTPNPYAKPQQPAAPYATPQQQATGRTPNPYAQRTAPYAAPQPPQAPAQTPANPYARPQTPSAPTADSAAPTPDSQTGAAAATPDSSQAAPRTSRRSDRYKGQNNDDL